MKNLYCDDIPLSAQRGDSFISVSSRPETLHDEMEPFREENKEKLIDRYTKKMTKYIDKSQERANAKIDEINEIKVK